MAQSVHARKLTVKPAVGEPAVDRLSADAHVQQLPPAHHTVLSTGDPGYFTLT
jgi:hypothetical protein